jgi:hypothetical protein
MFLGIELEGRGETFSENLDPVLQYVSRGKYLRYWHQYDLKFPGAVTNVLKTNKKIIKLDLIVVNTININFFPQFINTIDKEMEEWLRPLPTQ